MGIPLCITFGEVSETSVAHTHIPQCHTFRSNMPLSLAQHPLHHIKVANCGDPSSKLLRYSLFPPDERLRRNLFPRFTSRFVVALVAEGREASSATTSPRL